MQLVELAKMLVAQVNARPWAGHFNSLSLDGLLRVIDFDGPSNEHLCNPLNRDAKVRYFRPRLKSLTGNEEISGDYLLFDYCSHDESMKLREFESCGELETFILDVAGITNDFTTDLVPIIKGQIRDYTVSYFDIKTGSRKSFDKIEQYVGPEPFRDYPELHLHWID